MLNGRQLRFSCLAVSVAACAGLAGCGSSTTLIRPSAGITKAAYIARADAVCKRESVLIGKAPNLKIRVVALGHGKAGGNSRSIVKSNLASVASKMAPVLRVERQTLAKLDEIPVPAAGKDTIGAIWQDRAAMIDALDRSRQLLLGHGTLVGVAAAENKTATENAAQAALRYSESTKSYGFKVCGAAA